MLHDAPERAGYLFGGWEELETGAVYNARQAVSITCDMLLRAIWTEVPAGKAAVKFVNNSDLYDIILVDKGSNGVAPETAPTRPGYTFVEWRCDALNSFVRAGEPFGVAADADDLIVYTAVYTRNGYKLHFWPSSPLPATTARSPSPSRSRKASSFGYRPGRSAQMAILKVKEYAERGYTQAVLVDLSKYFDTLRTAMYSGQSRKKDSHRRDITASLTGTSLCTYAIEPPCTERYARWCERSLLDLN